MANDTKNIELAKCPGEGCAWSADDLRMEWGVIPGTIEHPEPGKIHQVRCKCGISGEWWPTYGDAAQSWNKFAAIGDRAREEQMEADCALSCPECKSGKYPAEHLRWEHGDDGCSIFRPATDDWGEWVHRKEGKTWFFCGAAKYREAFRLRKSEGVL